MHFCPVLTLQLGKKLYCFPNWPLPSHRIIGPGREYHDHGPGSCFVRSNWCRPVAEVLNNHPQIFCVAMTEEQGKFCIAVDEKGWDHLPRRAPEIHLDGAICGCRLLGLSIAFPIAFPIPQNWLLGRFLLCLVFRCVEPYEIGIAAVGFLRRLKDDPCNCTSHGPQQTKSVVGLWSLRAEQPSMADVQSMQQAHAHKMSEIQRFNGLLLDTLFPVLFDLSLTRCDFASLHTIEGTPDLRLTSYHQSFNSNGLCREIPWETMCTRNQLVTSKLNKQWSLAMSCWDMKSYYAFIHILG